MKRQWSAAMMIAALLLAVMPAAAQLQTRPPENSQPYGDSYIPEGTRFVVTLSDGLDTGKLETGKRVETRLGEDLVAPNGSVIPRGKKVQGHVSSIDRGLHGRVMISWDRIELNHGWEPIAATIVGIPGEHGVKTNGSEGEIEKKGTNKTRTAEAAVVGAGVGAATGAAAGGAHGAIIGAAVGGVAGGAAGILTDRNLKLAKGQQLELQLDRPLQVPR